MRLDVANELMLKLHDYDECTFYHSVNVASIGERLSLELGLGKLSQEIWLGCLLHDIGKLKIPKVLLDQTRQYDNIDYYVMKSHVVLGYSLVRDYLKPNDCIIKNIILQHHERLNGSGYPLNLYSTDISIYAQICAIADTFEAISNREYDKDKNVIDELLNGVINNSFNRNIVNKLILLIQKGEI